MTVTWSGDKELMQALNYMETKIDSKISYALNGLAYKANEDIKSKLPSWLQMTKGTRFITSSFQYDRSTPSDLSITLGALARLPFIELMEAGGVRNPQKRAISIRSDETKIRNVAAARSRKDVFSGVVNGNPGVYQRLSKKKGGGVRLLFSYEPRTNYKGGNIHFYDSIEEFLILILKMLCQVLLMTWRHMRQANLNNFRNIICCE